MARRRKSLMIKRIFQFSIVNLFIWIYLTALFNHLDNPFFKLNSSLHFKNIQLLIAHPDDEVMFFGPTINELLKPEYGNKISVTCFSTGNDAGLGEIRSKELERSLQILGIQDFEVINYETKFKDSMQLTWDPSDILDYLKPETNLILTFDIDGVSSHPNHISLYKAAIQSKIPILSLKTWKFWGKYSSLFVTTQELLKKFLKFFLSSNNKQRKLKSGTEITIFADVSSFILTISSMINAHKSQMVWFRWGWVFISRYLNSNVVTYINSLE